MLRTALPALALLPLALAGCDDITGGEDGGRVAIRFATSTTSSRVRPALAGAAEELVVTGSNGTLRIEDVRLIVAEFELKRADGSCADARGDDDDGDDCEEFEAPPALLDLPLGGGAVTLASDVVPPGTYTELGWEVEDLDVDDDEDADERRAAREILAQLRSVYPAFPSDASMVVKGSFTPTGGSPQPFVVFFEAEIEVERELVPPVTVPGADALTVQVDPAAWFRRGAQVTNLAAWNGRRIEFELEIRNGFGRIRVDD